MNEVCFFSANELARCKVELKDLVLSDLSRVSQFVFPELDQPRTKKGWCCHQPYLKNQCVVRLLVVDISNHRERVGAGDEVLLDYDCSFSTYAFETPGAALENHVARRDSSGKVHRTILDN